MKDSCIFCKIINKEQSCSLLYETGDAIAFLDIAPVAPGHTLVLPKKHVERITDLPDGLLAPVLGAVRFMASTLLRALEADGISLTQANGRCAGQVVPHLHFHLIPRYDGIPVQWQRGGYESDEEMRYVAEKILSEPRPRGRST